MESIISSGDQKTLVPSAQIGNCGKGHWLERSPLLSTFSRTFASATGNVK
jgi:hypothetical protein